MLYHLSEWDLIDLIYDNASFHLFNAIVLIMGKEFLGGLNVKGR